MDGYLAASYDVRESPAELARLEDECEGWRRRLDRLAEDVTLLRVDARQAQTPVLLDKERRLAAEAERIEAYADGLDERAARAADASA